MRELDRIRLALNDAASRGESALLATVMNVDGSVYRGAGARMVVAQNGDTTGGVSGGCLEADIVARASDLLLSGKPDVVRYDTRVSDDVVLGLGLGCQGVIDVLLEPLAGETLHAAVGFYERVSASREALAIRTLVKEQCDVKLGDRIVLNAAGAILEGDARLLQYVADLTREEIRPATPLLICGAGNDAIPLARLAKAMGWHVTVIDHRSSFATNARFPDADVVACINVAEDANVLGAHVDDRTMAVSMAHSATHDRAYVHALLDANASYIGILGPRRRTRELLGDRVVTDELPPNIYSPIGLDTGADTPDEIALSIVAEIAAVAAGREGGHLRHRGGPIHRRERALP